MGLALSHGVARVVMGLHGGPVIPPGLGAIARAPETTAVIRDRGLGDPQPACDLAAGETFVEQSGDLFPRGHEHMFVQGPDGTPRRMARMRWPLRDGVTAARLALDEVVGVRIPGAQSGFVMKTASQR